MTGIVSHMDLLCSVSGCLLYKTQKKPFKIAFIASINLDVCFTKTFYFALIDTVGPMLIPLWKSVSVPLPVPSDLPCFYLVLQAPL